MDISYILPASKLARLEESNPGMDTDDNKTNNEGEMDDNIKEHFLGMHTIYHISQFYTIGYYLPVSTLIEPTDELLVRVKSDKFISALKDEMLENPTRDVQPLLCIVRLKDDEEFDESFKEGYMYETIGGNCTTTTF